MGFLDHSTSNIIVDAVLTNIGRQFLARNDGSFSIVKFAFADDEVDYSMIKKYGRVVGKEKIEKNTPVFEAHTSARVALKYRLISNSNPNITRVPKLAVVSDGLDSTGTQLSMTVNSSTATRQLTFTQTIIGESVVDTEYRDQQFTVKVPNQFLQVVGAAPDYIDESGIATYTLTRGATTTAAGGSQLGITLATKPVTDTQFNVYGTSLDKTKIVAPITVTGLQSGTVTSLDANITK